MDMINRKKAPLHKGISKLIIPEIKKYILPNAIPLFVIPDNNISIIKLDLVFEAGSFFQEKCLVASTTNAMLREGTKKYSSQQLAEKIDFLGGYLNLDSEQDWASICIYSLEKYFEKMLPLLEEVVYFPTFPEKELDTYLKNQKRKFLIENKKMKFIARQKFSSLLFSKHPYGMIANAKDYDLLEKKPVVDFHNRFYGKGCHAIFLSGKINDTIIKKIEKSFGNNVISVKKVAPKDVLVNAKKEYYEVKDALQSAIRVGKILFNRSHPDFIPMQVLNIVLGGYFGSRLMSNLREDKGYTYGIGSFILPMRFSGYFGIACEVKADATRSALIEIYKEIDILTQKKILEKELKTVKNYLEGQLLRSIDGCFLFSEKMKSLILSNNDTSYFQHYFEILKTIDSEQLLALAQRYLQLNTLNEVIAGKK